MGIRTICIGERFSLLALRYSKSKNSTTKTKNNKIKMSYYQRLNEFRNTDIRYIGSGGYHLARKEFGLNVGKRLDKYNIPKKDKIYLKYADERYKREKQSEIKAKQNQKEQQ